MRPRGFLGRIGYGVKSRQILKRLTIGLRFGTLAGRRAVFVRSGIVFTGSSVVLSRSRAAPSRGGSAAAWIGIRGLLVVTLTGFSWSSFTLARRGVTLAGRRVRPAGCALVAVGAVARFFFVGIVVIGSLLR